MTYERMAAAAKGLLITVVFLIAMIVVLIKGPQWESLLFPVNRQWKVDASYIVGQDLIIEGTIRVGRQCQYLPPPMAKDSDGRSLIVESLSKTQNQRWVSGETYRYGPWVIKGGAGKKILVYQQHRCHFLWNTLTILGTVESTDTND